MTTPFYAGSAITAAQLNAFLPYSVYTAGTQQVLSTTQAPLLGLSVAVASGATYRIHGIVPFTANSTQTAFVTLSGPATSFFKNTISYGLNNGAVVVQSAIGSNSGCGSLALTNGFSYTAEFDAVITFSASGALSVSVATSAASLGYTCQAGAILDYWQPAG